MENYLDRIRYSIYNPESNKGSVLADHLAHQAVDDYQSMNFEFPDKSIMLVTDWKNLDRMKDPRKDPDGLWFLMEPQTHWVTALAL